MTASRDYTKAKISAVFRPSRRTALGTGGAGNPHETWNDLKALVQTAFVLDSDSVFTVSAWNTSRMIVACDTLLATCQEMLTLAQGLLTEQKTIEDISGLDEASSLLIQTLTNIQTGHNSSAATEKRQAAMSKISSFVGNNLVPAIDPALSGTDLRSPPESRRGLKRTLPALLELMTSVDDAIERTKDLVASVPAAIPTRMAAGIVRDTRASVNRIRRRMGETSPPDRAEYARDDLYELAADLTVLGLMDKDPNPVLERGGPYTCSASGSGPGATIIGTVSAPYRLIDTQTDTLRFTIDGVALGPVDLPAAKPINLDFSFPLPASLLNPWGFAPAPPPRFQFIVNGVRGAWVNIIFPTYSPAAMFALIAGTAGAFPLDPSPPNNPYLVDAIVPVDAAFDTINFRYNAFGPVSPLTDLGAHIGIVGSPGVLTSFGFSNDMLVPDPMNPGYEIYRTFWRPAQQGETIQAIKDGFPTARVEPVNTTILEGRSAYDPANPDRFIVYRYFGNATWNPVAGLLILETDFRKVRVGDTVMVGTTPGTVTGLAVDGVEVSLVTPLVAGSYTTAIRPASVADMVGKTLRIIDETGMGVDHRITAAAPLANGTVELQVSWNLYWAIHTPTIQTLDYQVNSDTILVGSGNAGALSSFAVVGGAFNASLMLGLPIGSTTGTVLQITDNTADFVAAGVAAGDLVTLASLPDNYVDAVLGPTDIRLANPIPGTFGPGAVRIFNRKYYEYNQLVASGLPTWTPPSQSDIEKAALECIRAAGAGEAATRLTALLTSLEVTTTSLQTSLRTYRATMPVVSPYMADARNALEESGADRAADALQSGDLTGLLSMSTDQASSARLVMQNIRKVSRKLLGTSVYNLNADRLEGESLQNPEPIFLDNSPIPQDIFGPPRSYKP